MAIFYLITIPLSLSLSPLVSLTTTTIQEFSSVCFMLYLTLCLLLSHYWPYINSLLFIIFKTTIFITIPYYIYYKRNFSQPPLQRKRRKKNSCWFRSCPVHFY